MKSRIPLPKGVPKTLRFQSVSFTVNALGDGRLAFGYYSGTERIVVKRRTIEELRADAERIANAILNAETAALDLTAEQRRIASSAFTALESSGMPLDTVARETAEAAEILGGKFSILEVTRYFARHNPGRSKTVGTAEVLERMIGSLKDSGMSDLYVDRLDRDIKKFATAVPEMASATTDDIRKYLRELRVKKGDKKKGYKLMAAGPRRRDNIRDGILRLFTFARDESYLPQDRKTAAEYVQRINAIKRPATYLPGEFAILLEAISPEWMPWLAIGGFGGLRTSEIFRIRWERFRWDHTNEKKEPAPFIDVTDDVAGKTEESRVVPILPPLAAWLSRWNGAMGPIYQNIETHGSGAAWKTLEDRLRRELRRVRKATGMVTKVNGLRHSFGTHRLAVMKSFPQVAYEMGNSVPMVKRYYNNPKPESEGVKYFALMPPHEASNVVTMPLGLEFGT